MPRKTKAQLEEENHALQLKVEALEQRLDDEAEGWELPKIPAAKKPKKGDVLTIDDLKNVRRVAVLSGDDGDESHDPNYFTVVFFDRQDQLSRMQTIHLHPNVAQRMSAIHGLLASACEIIEQTDPYTIPYPYANGLIQLHTDIQKMGANLHNFVVGMMSLNLPLRKGDGEPVDEDT